MRAVAAITLLLLGAAPAARADFLASQTLEVARVPAPVPADPLDARWGAAPELVVPAAPQVTIRLNDRRANAALDGAALRRVQVRAVTDGTDLAVLLEWPDATESRGAKDAVADFADAAALQFPVRFGAGTRLPYVGMGDEQQPVLLYLQRVGPAGSAIRQATAQGFGTSRRSDNGGVRGEMRYDAGRRAWRALFVRPLRVSGSDLGRALVPFSVAVWDGAAAERGGNKALSGWRFLRIPGAPPEAAYQSEMAWGHAPGDLGDPAKGKELFQGACSACHSVGADRAAPGIAPDLTSIGVIASPGYLRDSIVSPSTVIVPNPNPAQHQDRGAKPDARGAYPVDEGYVWFSVGPDGKRSSSMPDSAALPADDLGALVAYLMTLGATAPGGGTP